MRVRVYPYKAGSKSARELANAIGCLRLKQDTRFIPSRGDLVINWGRSELPMAWHYRPECVMNNSYNVYMALHKPIAYRHMKAGGVSVPEFTQSHEEALDWITRGHDVMARHTVHGKGGEGCQVVMAHSGDTLPNAPLYVRYMPKRWEFRVHSNGAQVIDLQQKKKRSEVPNDEVDYKIRSASRGWVFCRSDISVPDEVVVQAHRAVRSLGLHFGAVDVGYTENTGRAWVYEVNTAPGLEGTTVERYADYFADYIANCY